MSATTLACVIPNYNYAQFLPTAIDSVLNQTSPFNEIIVIDDGSTDNSLEVLRQYEGRIKLISIANGGQLGACRKGILAATSEYIYTLDADDYALPNLAAVVRETIESSSPRPVKVQFQLQGVDSGGKSLDSIFPSWPPAYARKAMLKDNDVHGFYISPPTSGIVWRRETLISLGIENFDARLAMDATSSLAMPYLGEIICVRQVLASYRVHQNSLSGWSKPDVAVLSKEIRIFRETWSEVIGALRLSRPSHPLYIHEREMMIACKENKVIIVREVWRFISGMLGTSLTAKQKAIMAVWSLSLLLPIRGWRDYCIEMKRSSANRSPKLRKLVNMVRL